MAAVKRRSAEPVGGWQVGDRGKTRSGKVYQITELLAGPDLWLRAVVGREKISVTATRSGHVSRDGRRGE